MTELAVAAERSATATAPVPGVASPILTTAYLEGRARRHASRRIPRIVVLLGIALLGYLVDVATKTLVVAALREDEPHRVGQSALQLRLIRNPGAAFGLGVGSTALFTLVTVAVIAAVLRVAHGLDSLPWAVALGMLLGGSLGNLTDRLARAPGPFRGRVVDFVQLPGWPIFNLADALICVAGVMIVMLALNNVPLSGRRRRRRR